MIRVVRVAGEGFNLDNREQEPKAIVVSNGQDELSIPVDDDIINAILHMAFHGPEQTKAEVTELHPEEEQPVVPPDDEENEYSDPKSGTMSI